MLCSCNRSTNMTFRHERVLKIKFPWNLKQYFFDEKWRTKVELRFWKSYTVDLLYSCVKSTKMTFRHEGVLKIKFPQNLEKNILFDEKWKKNETSILEEKNSEKHFRYKKNISKIEISRTLYFEHSFDSKTHFCDIYFDRQDLVPWPIVQNYVQFCKISSYFFLKCWFCLLKNVRKQNFL